jgi:hypothetical protein
LGPNTDVHEMAVACQIEYNIVTAVWKQCECLFHVKW